MSVSELELKDAVKAALLELLVEQRPLLRDLLQEVIEDIAMSRAIDEGTATPPVSREEVFAALEQ
jgi:hypothetical protein